MSPLITPPVPFLHRELDFYQTDDYFYLVPPKNAPDHRALQINRITEELMVVSEYIATQLTSQYLYPSCQVFGIFGVIQLIAGKYLILIRQAIKVGEILCEPIYRTEKIQIIPYQPSELHLTEEQKRYNRQFFQMLTSFLQAPYFFFSYTYDLSHSLQRLHQHQHHPANKLTFEGQSYLQRADRRFVWNRHLLADFSGNKDLAAFCIPIIYGFFSMHKIEVHKKQFTLILVSRRCVDRAGTRMWSRGIDEDGNVSNFVETEQILHLNQECCTSLLQARGSIPLHWSQLPDLRYKPPPTLTPNAPNNDSFTKHIRALLAQFESLVMVNLINHTGQEEVLLTKLRQVFHETAANSSANIHLECFDFHHECRHNQWDRLSILLESISRYIDAYGYFVRTSSNASECHYQRGLFRTNCIDSLDRTNVVQSLIAKCSLERQLQYFGIIEVGQRIEDFPAFYHIYRNAWADNADACSIQYAGTPALKTDFTRTGKRRFIGKVKDGINSMVRYYKNNFEDGFRQDAIDLILGHYLVRPGEGNSARCPLASRNLLKIFTFPLFLLFSISMFFFSLLLPTANLTEKFFYLLFWFSMSSSIIALMFHYGNEFIDAPTLVTIKKKK